MGKTLYAKVFDRHTVREVSPGQYQLAVDRHLVNEVSSPQAFEVLRERRVPVACPSRTYATADHSVSTSGDPEQCDDDAATLQVATMRTNATGAGIRYFDPREGEHGIIHVIAPERGLVHPGMLVVCGDSHTSTYGAFGALAFGIGTTQVRDVLGTQTLLAEKLRVRRIDVTGELPSGVYAKDVALYLIRRLGARGGVGYAYEFGGPVIERFSMEERMTLCNLAVEAGARCGYVNPDQTAFEYLCGLEYAPSTDAFEGAIRRWALMRSDTDACYDDRVAFDVSDIGPVVTWGVSPDQSVFVDELVPASAAVAGMEPSSFDDALQFMGMRAGGAVAGTRIHVAFIGSCTNGRLSDFQAVAEQLRGRSFRVAPHVRALVVPGSRRVRDALQKEGLAQVFTDAGFEFRDTGCSLCCGMNADRLTGQQVCASSSNRNFRGRQGSPDGRTLLMSPVMVAAAAIAGEVTDARLLFGRGARYAATADSMARPGAMMRSRVPKVEGGLIPLPGDDIDTDQIVAGRYLKWITFDGIEQHVFEDLRNQARAVGQVHPFDDPKFSGGRILLVNANFGCGSSREHAPQALRRFGIRAIVGQSFGEIFAANCVSIGLPCVIAPRDEIGELQALARTSAERDACLDLDSMSLNAWGRRVAITMREAPRRQLMEGTWDSLSLLIEGAEAARHRFVDEGK